jgi:hypothetical protein
MQNFPNAGFFMFGGGQVELMIESGTYDNVKAFLRRKNQKLFAGYLRVKL